MSNDKNRGELLAAFEAHKSRIATAMIGGGEGARVRQVLERVSLSDFEAGWQASREALVIKLPDHYGYDDPGEAFHAIKDCREAIESAGVKVTE
ncbi:hypothetical protein [Pseudomonas syringae]|uniref:Uncharacterized protein n=1 Tax=Pseudomonas syringae pv. syringae (strain B728a) TaxID=205918 RepID=Q4ZSM5_PSEU2|nr:hypothetical protein [Pseudomonas syringae]AAY37847.1 hypothetical protein Psyr_2808 [Pseudomonas syringae pv. syringae B728a]PYD18396.1 hypothetical protein DND47_04450 [Pseudomonas syringae pv. syringae]